MDFFASLIAAGKKRLATSDFHLSMQICLA